MGDIPSKDYFEYSLEETADFTKFYNENQNKVYDIHKETLKYCIQDVFILRKCFQIFRNDTITPFDIDPLVDATTIASTCFTIYLNQFKPKNIELFSIDRAKNNSHSKEALTWLQTCETGLGYKLHHARTFSGEKKTNYIMVV